MLCEDSEEDCEEAIALLFPSVAADWKWVSISICDYSVYLFSLFPYLSRFFLLVTFIPNVFELFF